MSTTYPTLTQTNFPDSLDTFTRMSDITYSDIELVNQYNTYVTAGNMVAANQILTDNPGLRAKILNADNMNKILDTLSALEQFFKNNVETYIDGKATILQNQIDEFIAKGDYVATTAYTKNNIVTYDNAGYICKADSTGNLPTNTTYWQKIVFQGEQGVSGTGLSFRGTYSATATYAVNDCVTDGTKIWACISDCTGQSLVEGTYWTVAIGIESQISIHNTDANAHAALFEGVTTAINTAIVENTQNIPAINITESEEKQFVSTSQKTALNAVILYGGESERYFYGDYTSLPYACSMAYADGKYVVAQAGKISYSTDGVTFTDVTVGTDNPVWWDIAYGAGKFVAVGENGSYDDTYVAYSSDGIHWTTKYLDSGVRVFATIAYGNGKFSVLLPYYDNFSDYDARFYTSVDGVAWTATTVSNTEYAYSSSNIYKMQSFCGKFVLPMAGKIKTSTDGKTFTDAVTSSTDWTGVAYANNQIIAVGKSSATGHKFQYVTSSDGETWGDVTTLTDMDNTANCKPVDVVYNGEYYIFTSGSKVMFGEQLNDLSYTGSPDGSSNVSNAISVDLMADDSSTFMVLAGNYLYRLKIAKKIILTGADDNYIGIVEVK